MASAIVSFTFGDLHSITTTGRPFRNGTMSGAVWCTVPGMRTFREVYPSAPTESFR